MNNWNTIITFMYPHEAHLAKNVLESEGIQVYIKDELTAQVNNFFSNAIGGVKLLVPENENKKALEVLKEAGYILENKENEDEEIKTFPHTFFNECPYCKSENVRKQKQPGYTVVISLLFLGMPLPFAKETFHCFDCGKEWKIK